MWVKKIISAALLMCSVSGMACCETCGSCFRSQPATALRPAPASAQSPGSATPIETTPVSNNSPASAAMQPVGTVTGAYGGTGN